MQVWVTTGSTESGDDIGPYVWAFEPTGAEVESRLRAALPEEYESVGFVLHNTTAATVKER
ncbi:hypothetical protein Cp1R7AA1_169 [Mesorhizobium phage Cp1R7A-A1]|nr:hypothetical protein Cp1R7AA1_169 [Mesorhizobium phage Cp1R7A-A1]